MWNDDWRMKLELENESCFNRLCDCRNTKNDILIMSKLVVEYNPNKTAEECLDRICEWVCCWNGQFEIGLSETEYKNYLLKLLRLKIGIDK